MTDTILLLGATGMLGLPAARALQAAGWQVRALARDPARARRMLGGAASGPEIEILPGDAADRATLQAALAGCRAAHINLPQQAEPAAVEHIAALAPAAGVERVSYVSATTAFEQNRWFPLVDVKLCCEARLRACGLPLAVFCPTWTMETLRNFVRNRRAVIVRGKNPPLLHFFAAADFGRIVAASYADERAIGRRLFVHGPQAFTLPEAMQIYLRLRYPGLPALRLNVWQARLLARLTRSPGLAEVAGLIAYFDRTPELGDPSETNVLFGAPAATLEAWVRAESGASIRAVRPSEQ